MEVELIKEYRDIVKLYRYSVDTDRRLYLCNHVDIQARNTGADVYYEVMLRDAWVWDAHRPHRFLTSAHVISYRDINVEEISEREI